MIRDLLPTEFVDDSHNLIFGEVSNLKLLFTELAGKEFNTV